MQPHQVFIYFCGCSVRVLVDSMLRIPIISTDKGLSSGGFICPVQSTLNLLLLINIFNPCRKMRGLNPEIKIIIISTYFMTAISTVITFVISNKPTQKCQFSYIHKNCNQHTGTLAQQREHNRFLGCSTKQRIIVSDKSIFVSLHNLRRCISRYLVAGEESWRILHSQIWM